MEFASHIAGGATQISHLRRTLRHKPPKFELYCIQTEEGIRQEEEGIQTQQNKQT